MTEPFLTIKADSDRHHAKLADELEDLTKRIRAGARIVTGGIVYYPGDKVIRLSGDIVLVYGSLYQETNLEH